MVEIDFGTLVSAVLARMDATESELTGEERKAPYAALQHYKREVALVIREVFDEAEAEAGASALPTCSRCGALLEAAGCFCPGCGRPLTEEAAARRLVLLLAEDAGMSPDDPLLQQALGRFREERPEDWDALVRSLTPGPKA